MTQIRFLSFAFLAVALFKGATFAAPIYYSFEGQVAESVYDPMPVGSAMQFVISVDMERPGEYRYNNGTEHFVSVLSTESQLWRYAELISGPVVPFDLETSFVPHTMNEVAFTKIGQDIDGNPNTLITFFLNNNDLTGSDMLSLDRVQPTYYSDIRIGDVFFMGDFVNELDHYIGFSGNVTVTGISSELPFTSSVPEPDSLWLLGIGLLGIGAIRKRTVVIHGNE